MRKLVFLAALLCGLLSPLAAASAAPAQQPLDKLFGRLKAAENAEEAKPLEAQILAAFVRSGSPTVDLLMSRAEAAQSIGDKHVARKLYDSITDVAPRFAEGWHRRALLQSETSEDEAAMISLQKAVNLNPRHFQAIAELAEMLEEYGDKPGALKMYRRALALDPQFEGLQRHIDGLSRDVEGQGI